MYLCIYVVSWPLEKELRKRLVKCIVWTVALYGAENWTLELSEQKRLTISDADMEKDGACKMDRENKKCSCARKSVWRKNNAGTESEEEKKLAGPLLAKEKLSAEGCSRRNGNGKEVRGIRYQMIDNFRINGLYEDTKRKAEKRVERRRLSLQWKNYPWAEHCDWLTDRLVDMVQDPRFTCVCKGLDSTCEWGTIQQLSISMHFYDV